MFRKLLATTNECHLTVLRVALGIMILPHGLQKTFGLFGGSGFSATMASFTGRGHIPALFAFLAIMAEFLGGIGLILGLFTRIAAFGVACNMLVAIFKVNLANGFFMNWGGKQRGEGIEFHIIAIAICIALMIRGGGSVSADRALAAPLAKEAP
jgi:putative oxidoreductase